ncbi:UDP-galactopyranose mutase [Clostridium felsineum]|uniref:UDP-galactopyranose mutase n=1 Tax=Clostridium felsineum TaxID=36839 RepID=A0A1S8LWG7_9CLOT|nr:UDP-galactopyranose mutase [Clostridium felsineum]URZ08145.1 UDP-galactopyranose mutase [Clostridium felsineum]URZ13176.1 UDP-galactopyranose mutase [Clostridium felsineum]
MKFKYIVVGAGIAGLVMAERIANELKSDVLVIEKRKHIGGNCYDYYDESGILIHKYGPHIFHTNYKKAWDYLSKFTEWNYYQHRVLTYIDGNYIPMPITTETINNLYNLNLSNNEVEDFLKEQAINISEIKNSEDVVLSKAGRDIYEKFFENYTKKQWDVYPNELDKSVISRIPVRYNKDTRYFTDRYQGIPKYGYTKMCENIIDNPKVHILFNTDYKDIINDIEHEYLIYTGPVDYYFDYKHGNLMYRSVKFELETLDIESYQETSVINYPNDYDFTRVTEYKKLTGQKTNKTTIAREYPTWDGEPYYPVPQNDYLEQYYKYKKEADLIKNVFFIGRLAEYQYYNIDKVVLNAMDLFENKIRRVK